MLDAALVHELAGRADVIVHLAAAVGVKLIVEQPLRSLITNIRGTENVLEAAALAGARVMVASTSEIYGKNASGPLPETSDRILGSPFVARWSYSEAKAVDEILAHAYWRDRGTEAIVVRLFNCVGPRQTGAYGMVVPSLVRQALAGEDVTVYGTGEQQRCFCHVFDTVAAVVALLDHPDSPGDPFNVGALNEVSINELAEAIVARTGSIVTDRARALRGRLRGGVRGHGAAGARHREDHLAHRVVAEAHAQRHPRRRDRAPARERRLTGQERTANWPLGLSRWLQECPCRTVTSGSAAAGPATDSMPPSAWTMSATACASRPPCSLVEIVTPRSSSTRKKSSITAR